MGSLDPAKILVILVIALVVLGPERLPRVARQLGGLWHEFTRIREDVTEEIRSAIPQDQIPRIPRPTPGAISGFVSTLTTSVNGSGTVPTGSRSPGEASEVSTAPPDLTERPEEEPAPEVRRPPQVVVHPRLGEFAFVPDDPSLN